MSGTRALFISYDGLLEPLGQSQVLQYMKGLARKHRIWLVTYEKAQDWQDRPRREALRREVREAGIRWVALRYHRRPSAFATSYDIAVGLLCCAFLCIRHRIRIVHARSYVSGVIALTLKRALGVRFLFDMRGFWPDEKVDAETWRKDSGIYRVAKRFERSFLLSADVVVSLTRAAVDAMRQWPYLRDRHQRFEVITTCTNLDHFRPPGQEGNGDRRQTRPFTLGYVGSVRGSYLFDPVLESFRCIRELVPSARLLVVTREDHEYIRERVSSHGIPEEAVVVRAASYSEVPAHMHEMDATAFFVKPRFSKLASAPTKLGEFLACGVPCLSNSAAGDMGPLIRENGVGVILDSFAPDDIRAAARRLVELASTPGMRERCVAVAQMHFSLEKGVQAYDAIYASLA